MHNCAIFGRLSNVRPHPNADRLQLATVLGNQVVVGLSAKNGDLGIYFDSNLQLSKEFAVANDLIRRKNPQTGKQEGGMFDPNCKVRTQKFRGEISDGFWCPTSYLEAVLNPSKDVIVFDWDSYEGYEFNDFNGVPICKKFVPVTSKSPGSGNPKAKSKKCSVMFKEHFDTEQFGKHVMDFKPGDLIIITEKLHGCVDASTIINTLEHGDLTIKEIVDKKLSVHIKSLDTKTGDIIYVPIDEHYFVPNDGEWFLIELEDGTTITITGNNPVWLPEIQAYRRVDELTGTEYLLVNSDVKHC